MGKVGLMKIGLMKIGKCVERLVHRNHDEARAGDASDNYHATGSDGLTGKAFRPPFLTLQADDASTVDGDIGHDSRFLAYPSCRPNTVLLVGPFHAATKWPQTSESCAREKQEGQPFQGEIHPAKSEQRGNPGTDGKGEKKERGWGEQLTEQEDQCADEPQPSPGVRRIQVHKRTFFVLSS